VYKIPNEVMTVLLF